MIAVARRVNEGIPFYVGQAEDVTLPGEWDAVSMLFHVINYQVSDAMVHDALTAARRFLVPQGILAFDFWNSDAVLRDPPARRVREIEIEGRSLYRLALPVAGRHRNGIDVRYEFRWDSPAGPLEHEEVHAMRHFSEGELTRLLRGARLRVLSCNAWMQDRALSSTDWYGLICACPADEEHGFQ
jgi:SAM-dependent methyltransferase